MSKSLSGLIEKRLPDGRWRIRSSGVRGWPLDAETTAEIVTALRAAGVEVAESSMGSPANASSYHLEAAFEGGCLTASTGNYWYGEKGAYIEGVRALAFVAAVTGRRITPRMLAVLRASDPTIDSYLETLKVRFRPLSAP